MPRDIAPTERIGREKKAKLPPVLEEHLFGSIGRETSALVAVITVASK
jgi:hypothetical protein